MIICQKCKSEDFFFKEKKGNYCAYCGTYIKPVVDVKLNFGKYKGRYISSLRSPREKQYLQWMLKNLDSLTSKVEIAAINQIN